ncbi:MAG TPA: acyl carrier protein [Balneolaceae bacterium]|nr:acyl carrier protein [Balneolaceae bacterium]
MNQIDYLSIIKKHLHRVAPEADLEKLRPADDLGTQLDIDSMDFYNIMVGISEELHVDIPEEQYDKLRSLKAIKDFLASAIPQN